MITDNQLRDNKNNLDLAKLDYDIALNELHNAEQEVFVFTGKDINEIHELNTDAVIEFENYELEDVLQYCN